MKNKLFSMAVHLSDSDYLWIPIETVEERCNFVSTRVQFLRVYASMISSHIMSSDMSYIPKKGD